MKTYEQLQAENNRLRGACQLALDWCEGSGPYSEPGSDTIVELAETVAPLLSSALGKTTEADTEFAALLQAAIDYARDEPDSVGDYNGESIDALTDAALAWWQAMGKSKALPPQQAGRG